MAVGTAFAFESAVVLPKGVSRFNVEGAFYSPVDERYDPDGDKESVATNFNTELGENIFPGMIPPGLNIGTSVVDFEYKFTDLVFDYQYGVTDKLSVGIHVPYWWQKTDLKEARVDTSNANLGFNPAFATDPSQPPFIPVSAGGVRNDQIATDFVLTSLEVLYGYEPFDTWSDSGIADIEAGARYQYFKSDAWRLAVTGGAVLPTGKFNSPDNLLDLNFGRGTWALFLHANNDYTGIEKLTLNASVGYELVLPDSETMRVLFDVNRPIVPEEAKEDVDRNLGDVLELSLSGEYELSRTFSLGAAYEGGKKFKDDVSGDRFPAEAYDSLEEETDWTYHQFLIALSYSTLPLYEEKKFSVPLEFTLQYENVFAGSNNYLKQQIFYISAAMYF